MTRQGLFPGGRPGSRCAALWRDDLGEKMKITLPGIETLPQRRPRLLLLLLLLFADLRSIQGRFLFFFGFLFPTTEEIVSHISWSLHIPVVKAATWWNISKIPAARGDQISGFSEFAAALWCFWPGAELSRLLSRESQGFVHSG